MPSNTKNTASTAAISRPATARETIIATSATPLISNASSVIQAWEGRDAAGAGSRAEVMCSRALVSLVYPSCFSQARWAGFGAPASRFRIIAMLTMRSQTNKGSKPMNKAKPSAV
jgi:hypothetical protein